MIDSLLYVGGWNSKPDSEKALMWGKQAKDFRYVWNSGKTAKAWLDEVKRAVHMLPKRSVVVAHSLGAWAVLIALAKSPRPGIALCFTNPLANFCDFPATGELAEIMAMIRAEGIQNAPIPAHRGLSVFVSLGDKLIPREWQQAVWGPHTEIMYVDSDHDMDGMAFSFVVSANE